MDEQLMYKLEVFEGPLDLLLNLISKNKMKIEDIQIAIICDQYMEYLATAEKMNIDLSADFLVMASQLMLIKSRTLLPRAQEEEEDPAEELARMLLEYKHAKEASQKLGDLFSQFNGRMEKDTDEIAPDRTYVAEHDVYLLQAALLRVMNTIEVTDEEASERIRPLISTRTVSVSERVYAILRIFLTEGEKLNVLKCFKDATGLTPKQYRDNFRINAAKDLLVNSNYKIAQVSQIIGFTDPLYFSRFFKKSVGISPIDYRNQ